MTHRRRALVAALAAAFLAAFAGLGALTKLTAPAAATLAPPLPTAPWFWTMAVAPHDASVLVLATSDGLFRSADGGRSWRPTGPKDVNATSVVVLGRDLLAGGVEARPDTSPVKRFGRGRVVPDGRAVLVESADGGRDWHALHPRGLPHVAIQALAVDPEAATHVYALLNDGGLYESTDAARSFRVVTPNVKIIPWALAVTQDGRLVAGDMDTGNRVSAGGRTWQETPFRDPRGTRMVMEYAVQPGDASHVLMTSYGIFASDDGGKTWHVSLRSPTMFGPVAWAPGSSQVAYAVGFDSSLWRTSDGGSSWSEVAGPTPG